MSTYTAEFSHRTSLIHFGEITSIRHKGLRQYYEEGRGAKLPHDQLGKIARILDALDAVSGDDDISAWLGHSQAHRGYEGILVNKGKRQLPDHFQV